MLRGLMETQVACMSLFLLISGYASPYERLLPTDFLMHLVLSELGFGNSTYLKNGFSGSHF
jgi:hypothetical protein